jgi:type IX secretion system PorP/SprF family membrane protein
MPQAGVGAMIYSEDYFVSLSLPQLISNNFQQNRNNYSALAELRYAYLVGGYIFGKQRQVRFKPTAMIKAAKGAGIEADIAANILFYNRYWIGGIYRTNNTFAVYTQLQLTRNIHIGYAIDYPMSLDIRKYQYGTHEFKLVYEYDFYRRPYTKTQYF